MKSKLQPFHKVHINQLSFNTVTLNVTTMASKAKKFVLKQNFVGEPKDSDLQIEEEDLPALNDGDVLFEAEYLSVDPYMRPYSITMKPGETMIGQQLAKVTNTRNDKYPVGSKFLCDFGWRTHTVVNPDKLPLSRTEKHIVTPIPDTKGLAESLTLGSLGMPGVTAYFGLLEVCNVKPGDVVLVNGAAGAVGTIVGQIAKIKGCTAIGYAGTDAKVKWLKEEVGFDFAFNYKTCDLSKTLKEAAPEGVDCYFDNVGGTFSATVILNHMKTGGRIACCGAISAYNATEIPTCAQIFRSMIGKKLRMQGFIVYQYKDQYPAAVAQLVTWAKEGKLKCNEHVTEGFDNMRKAFYGMLKGENTGKAVVKA